MAYEFILHEITEGVARITLNRPDVLNSFNARMAAELKDALKRAAADPGTRAVFLTGNGRGFCAGQDLAEVLPKEGDPMPDLGNVVRDCYNPVIRAIRSLEKPVVCAVNGVAAGAGANLALACDIVIASDDAAFVQSFAKIGVIPDTGGTFFLPRAIGLARATAYMMLCDKISAEKACEIGMIYRVCPHASLMDVSLATAKQLAAMPTRGLGLTKRLLNASLANDLDAQLDLEEEGQREAGRTEDYAEGVRAFLEKRKPHFVGR